MVDLNLTKVDSGKDVSIENRRFTLVQIHEGRAGDDEPVLVNATNEQVLEYLRTEAVVDPRKFNPLQIMKDAGIFKPHHEEWRGGAGQVRICSNPALGLRRTY